MLQNSSLLLRKSSRLTLSALIIFLSIAVSQLVAAEKAAEPNLSFVVPTTEKDLVNQACELVYQGKFDAADEMIKQSGQSPSLSELAQIVSEYGSINQKRKSAKETAYKEQLEELEKLRVRATTSLVLRSQDDERRTTNNWFIGEWLPIGGILNFPATGPVDVSVPADLDELNRAGPRRRSEDGDGNDITTALSVIVKACEFAQPPQKEQLLSDAFVKGVLQKAIDKAAYFEAKGKWLEAYINCYYWLQEIEPENPAYSDYAQQLLDKASIAASFQDSPCESREERYTGVQKEMFIRALDALSINYVSIIDYSQMAIKAIERCKLLAEVAAAGGIPNFSATDGLTAWSASLSALAEEVRQSPTGFDKDKFIDVFEKVLSLNATTAELPTTTLIAQFVEAALFALDPYTALVWPKQAQDFEETMTSEFTGIGIEITKEKGKLLVAGLLPDTPAYKAGLDAGDIIETVDGLETKDMSLTCARQKIKGPKGTKVTLAIRREGLEKTKDFIITRDKITVPTIRGWQRTEEGNWLYMIDERNRIGYVQITSFAAETAGNLERTLKQLEAKGLKGLILDLRFNSGGLLDSAVDVSDKFLKKGLIVKRQPGSGLGKFPIYAVAHEEDTHPDYPLVILINSGSASASEIVAGALADVVHKRAILVGERTHGKGSVQEITHYPGGGAQLKYTMAYYYLPSGQRVESQDAMKKQGRTDWGVGPNIEVDLTSEELRKMLNVQRDNDVLVQADRSNSGHEVKKYNIEETLAADPQLAVAVLAVKTKLIQADSIPVRSY